MQTDSPPSPTFFHHGPSREPSTGPMQSLTRYLAAATYLDKDLCDKVIREYVYDWHRAIVPSHGYDLEPVIRHARRARRMRIVRDLLIGVLWLSLLILLPALMVSFALALGYWALLFRLWRRLSWPGRFLLLLAPTFPALIAAVLATGIREAAVNAGVPPLEYVVAAGLAVLVVAATLFGLFSLVVVGHLALVLRRLARDLGPGADGPGPGGGGTRFDNALARVRASQNGNVTLCEGDNPFLGAGDPRSPNAKVWSVILELDRRAPTLLGEPASPDPSALDQDAAPATVDPVVMHDRIRAKLLQMRDESAPGDDGKRPLPTNERIHGLVTGWHVVARGRCVQRPRPVDAFTRDDYEGHPLIDPTGPTPFSVASQETVEAAIRHPQGGVRCFQRVSVGVQGQSIRTPDGRVVAPAEEQDAAMSAFVHLAVEGRMLYARFVVTVLPPVHDQFKIVDQLPVWGGGRLVWNAFRLAFPRVLLTAPLLGPFRLVSALWRIIREASAADAPGDPRTDLVHEYGARISVRELVADADARDLFQELDVDKYTRLIERRVNEALLDYLGDECGIDVSTYRTQASVIMNQGVIMTGGTLAGQVAVGERVQQRQSGADRINP
ncbi:hypothetical protein [Actinomadura pelletieri]|uniref:hypothetical protein n=1 Tax=Actinomadura pelletieri TaxID=111805 RepID=UPI0011C392FC|nr:hypothetical protein [Actinomadura pelletieri]